jgi:hypothetical protein
MFTCRSAKEACGRRTLSKVLWESMTRIFICNDGGDSLFYIQLGVVLERVAYLDVVPLFAPFAALLLACGVNLRNRKRAYVRSQISPSFQPAPSASDAPCHPTL